MEFIAILHKGALVPPECHCGGEKNEPNEGAKKTQTNKKKKTA